MKHLLFLSLLFTSGCSTAGFMYGVKCSYVNCNTAKEFNMSAESRRAEGDKYYAETDEGSRMTRQLADAKRRNPKLYKDMQNAVSDDVIVLQEKTDRNGRAYIEAK